jgi:hypothetical protein
MTLKEIERQYKNNLNLAEGIELEGMKARLDQEMRRLGKVRSNFRNTKQYKALVKLATIQCKIKNAK